MLPDLGTDEYVLGYNTTRAPQVQLYVIVSLLPEEYHLEAAVASQQRCTVQAHNCKVVCIPPSQA